MKKIISITGCFLFVLGAILPLRSQGITTVSGIIVDKTKDMPLSGVNVFIPGKTGTFSDNDGYFELRIKKISAQDSVHFSFMGFKEIVMPVMEIKSGKIIFMQPQLLKMGKEIIVTGQRENLNNHEIETARSRIPLKEIERHNSFDISSIFKTISSVRIAGNDLDGRTIQIRGSNSDEVNVYVDGIMLNSVGKNESADLSLIPVEDLGEIIVDKGGNLLLTGQGAFGGVVNITTRNPSRLKLRLSGNLGSYKSRNGGSFLYLPIKKSIFFKYYFNYSHFSPEIEYFPDEKYSPKTHNDHISTIKHHHNASLSVYTPHGKIAIDMFNYYLNYTKSNWKNINDQWLYSLRFQGASGISKDFELFLNHHHEASNVKRGINVTDGFKYDDYVNRTNLKIAKKISFRKNYVQWVADYYHDELDSRVIEYKPLSNKLLSHGSFYDNHVGSAVVFTFKDNHPKYEFLKWSTYIGLRADVLASGNKDFSKAFGGNFELELENSKYKIFFNHGSNVKYPTLIERTYLKNFQQITLQDTTTTPVNPEYQISYQAGFEGEWKNISSLFSSLALSVTAFHNDVYNVIIKRPFGEAIIQDQNGRSTTEGVETSVHLLDFLNVVDVSSGFLGMNISNKILYAFKPRTNLFLQLSAAPTQNFDITGRLYREGESYGWFYDQTDTLRTQKLTSFWDLDVSFSARLHVGKQKLGMKITGSNILDAAGFRSYYLNKRYWQFGLWFEI